MGRLAKLPNIVGVKDATADIVRPLADQPQACGADFCQLSGEDGNVVAVPGAWRQGLHLGDRQCGPAASAPSCTTPGARAGPTRRWPSTDRLLPLHKALFCETSPSPTKYALGRLGRCEPERAPAAGRARRAARKAQVDAALAAVGINL